jgi:hypothetical protein
MTMMKPDSRTEAETEARRLIRARALTRDQDDEAVARLEGDRPWMTVARGWRTRRELGSRVLLIWSVALEDTDGMAIESRLVAVAVTLNIEQSRRLSRQALEHLIRRVEPQIHAELDRTTAGWQCTAEACVKTFASARTARRRAILQHVADGGAREYQPGLFDRRAERARSLTAVESAEADGTAARQLAASCLLGTFARRPAQLLLVLVP